MEIYTDVLFRDGHPILDLTLHIEDNVLEIPLSYWNDIKLIG